MRKKRPQKTAGQYDVLFAVKQLVDQHGADSVREALDVLVVIEMKR